jgi:HEAT repeat protein
MRTLLLALLVQDLAPNDNDAEAALRKFKAECLNSAAEGKTAALREVVKTRHERVARAVGEMLVAEADPIRIAAAIALGDLDHPASSEVLSDALRPNLRREEVFRATLKTIGELGWQSPVARLHDLLSNTDPAMGPVMPDIVSAIGQLRSLDSMDPLIHLLNKFDANAIGRKIIWPNEDPIVREIEVALRSISGQDFRKAADWQQWWRAYRDTLRITADRCYWLTKTQTRVVVVKGDRVPADAVLVWSRAPLGKSGSSPGSTTTRKKGEK